ncbi:MAG: 2-oxoglutarate dehydrogenase E1 component [Rickettsiales bacterium]|nr:2-oxoglutarate dehydrogenase E1 component [Rickettsiales bacterium]
MAADLNVTNLTFAEQLYERFLDDPNSVEPAWRQYFESTESGRTVGLGPTKRPASIFRGMTAPQQVSAAPAKAPGSGLNGSSNPEHLRLLRGLQFFSGMSDQTLEFVSSRTVQHRVKEGDYLIHQGAFGDGVYFVLDGVARVERGGEWVANLGPGEVIGGMSFTPQQTRAADVISHTELRLLKLDSDSVDTVLNHFAGFARRLFEITARRLRTTSMIQQRVGQLVRLYRVRGHVMADLDPLGRQPEAHPELELDYHGLSENDLDQVVYLGDRDLEVHTLRSVVGRMKKTYCNHIGVQFMHIEEVEVQEWLQERMESTQNTCDLSRDEQVRILTKLTEAELFEQFIHAKYLGAKRFSLEGAESLIPLLDIAIEEAAERGIQKAFLGMAHRGRLNVLANIMGKQSQQIFTEFEDANPEQYIGKGDVKYHMGFSSVRTSQSGREVHLSLCFNPSHLAFITPVVQGRVRATQDRLGDDARDQVMGIVIHGDAAFAGQGVIQESLNLSQLEGYRSGGTLHIVVNNQVGFTTDPDDSRSCRYATDVAKMLQVPVFHVNGEHPDAVAQVIRLAMEFRSRWGRDVVIDMYCYRRHGHNEGDEPRYTQPEMYQRVDQQGTVRENFVRNMVALGVITEDDAAAIAANCKANLESDLAAARGAAPSPAPASPSQIRNLWAGFHGGLESTEAAHKTAVSRDMLVGLMEKITATPDIKLNRKLGRLLKRRAEMGSVGESLDWWAGEALAFASLLVEGTRLRVSGQDSQRGTFSHRHAVLQDQSNGQQVSAFDSLAEGQGKFDVFNSPLSEAAVLAFDFGYSLEWPDGLVIWEAQFGDFANGAQVIIDQFISTSEDKWSRLNGLVMLLPHGFEGQGPEHSSARLERFLTLAAEDNMRIVNLTNPAQFFHALRRQLCSKLRKPLVVMTPKSLLRHPKAVSALEEFSEGGFQKVIKDPTGVNLKQAPFVLLCSGKLYYELEDARASAAELANVPILRLEQLYPFPEAELCEALADCPDGIELRWVQEEPANMGAWRFVREQFEERGLKRLKLVRLSRPESASPATGSGASHKLEQSRLLSRALDNG